MANIEELLRKRKELLEEIDKEIKKTYTKPLALMFTDIVGSTAYFEKKGDIAGRQMIQTHNDLLFPVIKAHGGRVIKTIGDSIMASFENPLDGVTSAINMQQALTRYNKDKPDDEKIRVRMGLHFGEAVVDEKDLFGDVVNTSARVEARAYAGEIIISSSLKKQIESSGLPVVFLGSDFVKGKNQRIDFFLINWDNRHPDDIAESWKHRNTPSAGREKKASSAPKVVIRRNIDLRAGAAKPKPLSAKGNPYLNRVMLPHPAMFFGRKALIRRIFTRLTAQRPQSVSLVGERRIGKSSLLNYLNFPGTRLAFTEDAEQYIQLFIDFQQLRTLDEGGLIAVIFKELERQLKEHITLRLAPDFDGMHYLCEAVTQAGYKFILFFDEFESVTKNEKIGPEFYSFFRSLANNFSLAFVTATGRNLKDMCVTHEISDSPFFNIFTVQNVGLFKNDEAYELITGPSAHNGIPLEPLKEQILEQGGRYPFFLQMLCSAWFEFLESEGLTAADLAGKKTPREVESLFREESEPHFEYILETLQEQEIDCLKTITAGGTPDPQSVYTELLEKKGYIMRGTQDEYTPFSAQFELFLRRRLVT
jgi:class 3 adenylate cyclase